MGRTYDQTRCKDFTDQDRIYLQKILDTPEQVRDPESCLQLMDQISDHVKLQLLNMQRIARDSHYSKEIKLSKFLEDYIPQLLNMIDMMSTSASILRNFVNEDRIVDADMYMDPAHAFKYIYDNKYINIVDTPTKYSTESHDAFVYNGMIFIRKEKLEYILNNYYKGIGKGSGEYQYTYIIRNMSEYGLIRKWYCGGRCYNSHHFKMRDRADLNGRYICIILQMLLRLQ